MTQISESKPTTEQIIREEAKQFFASIINSTVNDSTSQISVPTDFYQQIKLAKEIRNTDASSIVDFMVSAANTGIEIQVPWDRDELAAKIAATATTDASAKKRGRPATKTQTNEKQRVFKNVCEWWAKHVNENVIGVEPGLDYLNETFFEEMWGCSSLWLCLYTMQNMKTPYGSFKLPMRATVINPEVVNVVMKEKFGECVITIGDEGETNAIEIVSDDTGTNVFQVLNGKREKQEIKRDFILSFGAGKKIYERVPVPYLLRTAKPYKLKQKMYEADYDVVDNMLAALLLIQEGSESNPPDRDQIKKLATNVKTIIDDISTQKLRYFTSGPTTKMQWVYPDVKALTAASKYFQADVDFLKRLGIIVQPSLNDSNSAFKLVSISPLIEIMEYGRSKCRRVNEQFLNAIRIQNTSFKDIEPATVRMKRMKGIEDAHKFKTFLQTAHERGLPWDLYLSELGYEMSDVVDKALYEKNSGIADILSARSTFNQTVNGGDSGGRPKKDEESDAAGDEPYGEGKQAQE